MISTATTLARPPPSLCLDYCKTWAPCFYLYPIITTVHFEIKALSQLCYYAHNPSVVSHLTQS